MEYMIFALLIIGFGFANRLWGSGWFSGCKEAGVGVVFAVTGMALELHHQPEIMVFAGAVISALLFWFGRLWPLSYYFRVFNPGLSSTDTGIAWINDIAGTNWWLCMTLRGAYFIPFIALFGSLDWHVLPLSLGALGMGTIYWLQKFQPKSWWTAQWQLPVAESMFGGLLGLLAGMAICL